MRIFFGFAIFLIVLGIGVLIVGFILQSTFNVSVFGGREPRAQKSQAAGILLSENRGENWQFRNAVPPLGDLSRLPISDFIFDPKTAGRLYIGTKDFGLLKTENGGETWVQLTDTTNLLTPKTHIAKIALDPTNPDVLYLATFVGEKGRILVSGDGGKTFREVYTVATAKTYVTDIVLDAHTPTTIYTGTSSGLFLESIDGGVSWKVLAQFQGGIRRILPVPSNPSSMYVITPEHLYRTVNRGRMWQELTPRLEAFKGAETITDFVFDPYNDNRIYLGSQFGLLVSENGGQGFREIPTIIPRSSLPVLSIAVDLVDPRTLYVTSVNQLYTTFDGGNTWNVKNLPVTAPARSIRVDPYNPPRLYMVSGD